MLFFVETHCSIQSLFCGAHIVFDSIQSHFFMWEQSKRHCRKEKISKHGDRSKRLHACTHCVCACARIPRMHAFHDFYMANATRVSANACSRRCIVKSWRGLELRWKPSAVPFMGFEEKTSQSNEKNKCLGESQSGSVLIVQLGPTSLVRRT